MRCRDCEWAAELSGRTYEDINGEHHPGTTPEFVEAGGRFVPSETGVYVICVRGYTKIGMALDIRRRLWDYSLQGCPAQVYDLVGWVIHGNMAHIESALHDAFAGRLASGEWFTRLEPAEIRAALLAIGPVPTCAPALRSMKRAKKARLMG